MIRDAGASDFEAIVRLNRESEKFLSPMDSARLRRLHAQCAYCRVVEEQAGVTAFLLAFREGADYDSENYRWFADRYPSFLYIDRVVVDASRQGAGLGAKLYEDLFAFGRAQGAPSITCEFDVEPPNEVSRRFHERFGFREVGTQRVTSGNKRVSLQAVSLSSP